MQVSVYPQADSALPEAAADQVRATFEQAREDFETSGLTLANLVKVRFFYTDLADAAAMTLVRNEIYPVHLRDGNWPASTGVVTGGRGGAAPRFECQLIAGPDNGGTRSDEVVSVWGDSAPKFSHAHTTEGLVFLSGQGPYRVDGTLLGSDARTQTEGALSTFAPILASASLTTSAIVTITAYLTPAITGEVGLVSRLIDDYCERQGITPVLTLIPVRELAYGMNIEIEATASRVPARFGEVTRPTGCLGRHPLTATAAVVGGTLFASGSAVFDGQPGFALAELFESLNARASALGAEAGRHGMVTIWCSDTLERGDIEARGRELLGLGDLLTVAPMPAANGQSALIIEMVVAGRQDATPEPPPTD